MADRRRQRRPSNPYQGLGILIAFALIIVFIASFWQVIIGCLIGAFVVYVVWRFREEICQGIAAFFRFIIRLFSGVYHRIHDAYTRSRENTTPENTTPENTTPENTTPPKLMSKPDRSSKDQEDPQIW